MACRWPPGAGQRRGAATVPTSQLLSRYHPGVTLTEELEAFAVPIAVHRCRELPGSVPAHAWRRR